MIRLWALVVFVQLGAQWLVADANVIKPSQRSSADDVTFIDQDRTIYQSRPGTYRYYDGQHLRTCELCEPGHYLIRHCDDEHWRTCGQCPYNFYMPFYNNGDRCRSCGDICDGDLNLVTLQECSPTAPRRCACRPGTAQVHLGANGPGMCKPYETAGTTDSKHDNVTSLRGPNHNVTTQEATTSTSATGNTTAWDQDSSFANDTLSYDLAENESIIRPLAGGLGGLAGIIVVAVVIGACYKGRSTSKVTENISNKEFTDVEWKHVFNYVADHIGKGWRHLARKLPGDTPTQATLDSIRDEYRPDFKEMAFQMLRQWKQMNGDKISLHGLQWALLKSGYPLIARQLGKRDWHFAEMLDI